MKLSQLGEFGLIDLLSKEIGKPSGNVMVGVGDDAAVIEILNPKSEIRNKSEIRKSKLQLITTDTLIENIHFKVKKTSFFDLGHKALAINISDIAAMGGVPTYAVVSIGANKRFPVKKIKELYRGLRTLAKKHQIDIVGGDTVQSPRDLMISITLLGEVEKENLLLRSTARVGDAILVTGGFGGPAAEKFKIQNSKFKIRLNEAGVIAKSHLATAMIDSSDGLVRSVLEICKASKVGARIWTDSVPRAKKATLEQALYGGEEYELVFTVPRARAMKLQQLIEKKTKTKIAIVGEIVGKGQGIKLVDPRGAVSPLQKKGYEHFKD